MELRQVAKMRNLSVIIILICLMGIRFRLCRLAERKVICEGVGRWEREGLGGVIFFWFFYLLGFFVYLFYGVEKYVRLYIDFLWF